MAHFLLIARFTMDDIPLALLKDKSWAEKHAKDLQADPSLLDTKWKKALDAWPAHAGGFAGAVVLQIDVMGDPVGVTFDSTEDGEAEQPADPQPIQSTIPVPDGYIEITDPNHKLRPHVDFYLSLNCSPGEWMPITETGAVLISDLGTTGRFCCPADKHPDRQPPIAILAPDGLPPGFVEITDPRHFVRVGIDYYADRSAEKGVLWRLVEKHSGDLCDFSFACPATQHPDLQGTTATSLPTETDELTILREANEILVKKQVELVNDIAILRKANVDLLAENNRVAELNSQWARTVVQLKEETDIKADQMTNDGRAYALLSTQNASLRQLNEDLNHRLNATLARASHATDLESRIRRMAINFVQFHAKLRERRIWSSVFATEKQMSPAYTQALLTVDSAFTDVFLSFMRSFPHVQPDMPDEWQIGPEKTDDDDGTTD